MRKKSNPVYSDPRWLRVCRIVKSTEDICAACGKHVDKDLHYTHPMSGTVDHIVPLDMGGAPFSLENAQLMHRSCNSVKNNKLVADGIYNSSGAFGSDV